VVEQFHEVTAPSDRYHGTSHHVFEDQIPTDEPGDELAQGGVTVGIGAAGDGHHGCEFGITKTGEHAAEACHDEGNDDGRPGVLCRGQPRQHENPGTDDAPDAEGDQ